MLGILTGQELAVRMQPVHHGDNVEPRVVRRSGDIGEVRCPGEGPAS